MVSSPTKIWFPLGLFHINGYTVNGGDDEANGQNVPFKFVLQGSEEKGAYLLSLSVGFLHFFISFPWEIERI